MRQSHALLHCSAFRRTNLQIATSTKCIRSDLVSVPYALSKWLVHSRYLVTAEKKWYQWQSALSKIRTETSYSIRKKMCAWLSRRKAPQHSSLHRRLLSLWTKCLNAPSNQERLRTVPTSTLHIT